MEFVSKHFSSLVNIPLIVLIAAFVLCRRDREKAEVPGWER
jgi:hypothetical protein